MPPISSEHIKKEKWNHDKIQNVMGSFKSFYFPAGPAARVPSQADWGHPENIAAVLEWDNSSERCCGIQDVLVRKKRTLFLVDHHLNKS